MGKQILIYSRVVPRQHPKTWCLYLLCSASSRGVHTLSSTRSFRRIAPPHPAAFARLLARSKPSSPLKHRPRRRVAAFRAKPSQTNKRFPESFPRFYKDTMQAAISLPAHVNMDVMRRPHMAKRLGLLETPPLTKQIDAFRGAFALDVPRRPPRRVSPFSVTSPTQRLRGSPPKTAVTRRDARALEVTPDADPSRPVRSSRIRPPLPQHGGASPPRRRSTRRSPSTRLEHPRCVCVIPSRPPFLATVARRDARTPRHPARHIYARILKHDTRDISIRVPRPPRPRATAPHAANCQLSSIFLRKVFSDLRYSICPPPPFHSPSPV